ncbi:PP2C family protein-serine/threonine phosphatase [Nonomuraea rhodomycinica]|uniref:SpoIIE family protein phosphatase n=1 Tax=Nonomuraea rhodomycinica TaxID=1712872 RepID=A0A7Y6IP65_9ACTN|nr:PP2C family protein-serine/threonine phosphatase [Nonomuraea rhodomycinica]NUW41787.1 SpoIIE family protein phosphatase [Nonomuraea rhodomycinica]
MVDVISGGPGQRRRPGGAAGASHQGAAERELLAVRLAHAQRLGNMGWAEWDLRTGETAWSDQVYVIFGRDPAKGPADLPELAGLVEPDDLRMLEQLLLTVVHEAEAAQAEMRIRRGGELRNLRVVLEPLLSAGRAADDAGAGPAGAGLRAAATVRGVHAVFQDITGRRRAERIMSESRRQLLEARVKAAEERHVMLALREAILPDPVGCLDLPRTRIAVRYVPAEKTASLGGDWFEAAPLPDGRVLLAIGDVSGHGLPAIAHMAQLRHALVGLTMTGRPASGLLALLNDLVIHRLEGTTATAVIGHLDSSTRVFSWARAGNLAPVLVRDGVAFQLEQARGVLLGAACDQAYHLARVELREGDLLLMFTDGLVERRNRDIDEGLALVLAAAARLPRDDLHLGLDAALDRLLEEIGGPNPEDDACLLAVGIQNRPGP